MTTDTRTTQTDLNPWMALHLDGELGYTGGGYTRRMAIDAVKREFEGLHEASACGHCGAMAAYMRPTVGAVQCFSCRSLRRTRVDQQTLEVTVRWTTP